MNEELNEKTEEICQLHSENSRLVAELSELQSEIKIGQEHEDHLVKLLNTERKNGDGKVNALEKCEVLLKMLIDKNEDHKIQNETLNLEVI